MKTAVIYWSGTGNTEAMANAVADGMRENGAEVSVFTASEFGADKVAEFDSLAFGCPAMGAEVLEEDEFEPMLTAVEGSLKDKKVAIFGSYGWGDGEWIRNWEERCVNAGIKLAAEPLMINEAPDDDGIAACKALGGVLAS